MESELYYTTSTSGVDSAAAAGAYGLVTLFYLALIVLVVASLWKLFVKAGKPGWAAIVPIYNYVVMLQIIGRPIWWLLIIFFVPIFGWWLGIVAIIDFAKSYGKSTGFGIFMVFLPYIALPMLAFGKSQYTGPIAEGLDGFTPAPERAVMTTMPSAAPAAVAPEVVASASAQSPETSAQPVSSPESAAPQVEQPQPPTDQSQRFQ